jgi:DNA-binding NtrC family response regulator
MDDAAPESRVTRVVERSDRTSVLQVQRARLQVVEGPDRGLEKEIPPEGLVVGSGSACDLILDDPSVSRRHFELRPVETGYRLRDRDSTNGTYVRGLRLTQALLVGDEEIEIGATKIRLVILEGVHELALSDRSSFGTLRGRGVEMRRALALLEQAAANDSTVLLEGESGTGKDHAAEAIHQASVRAGQPFVVVDCAAMQPTLMQSELFGHRQGAFTGAEHDRVGAFEAAEGGTVFLNEIGELPLELQPLLLRVLERREVQRVGDDRPRTVDVRLIAATNRDLERETAEKRFRHDLFFRIAVLRVRMPSLREHPEDIGMLAKLFVQHIRPDMDPVEVISDQVLSLLIGHDWPGNVRELRNVVERLILLPRQSEQIFDGFAGVERADWLETPFHRARGRWVDHFERIYLLHMLDTCDGVVTQAAARAEIPRQTFHRLMKKHGLGR